MRLWNTSRHREAVSQPTLEGSRYSSAETSPGYLFWKTFHSWQRAMRAKLEPLAITQVQYSILATASYLASASDGVSQQDVANQLSMDKMMVSSVVKTLEARALVTRTRSATDGRAFRMVLTRMGRDLLRRATPAAEGVDEEFFGTLSLAERRTFMGFLQRLNTSAL